MSREYPYPPRMMTRARAAHYCDLSLAEFEREVACGRLPIPSKLGKKDHWSRIAIDEALDRLADPGADDWRSRSNLYRNRDAA